MHWTQVIMGSWQGVTSAATCSTMNGKGNALSNALKNNKMILWGIKPRVTNQADYCPANNNLLSHRGNAEWSWWKAKHETGPFPNTWSYPNDTKEMTSTVSVKGYNRGHFLSHKVKMQYVYFRSHAEYFLLPWKIPLEISRRSMIFHNLREYLPHKIFIHTTFYHVHE